MTSPYDTEFGPLSYKYDVDHDDDYQRVSQVPGFYEDDLRMSQAGVSGNLACAGKNPYIQDDPAKSQRMRPMPTQSIEQRMARIRNDGYCASCHSEQRPTQQTMRRKQTMEVDMVLVLMFIILVAVALLAFKQYQHFAKVSSEVTAIKSVVDNRQASQL